MPDTYYTKWLRDRGLLPPDPETLQPPPLLPPAKSTWGTIQDIIGTPANMVASGVYGAQRNEDVGQHVLDALLQKEHHNFGEVLADAGVAPGAFRTGAGLALDIGTDPLTYLGGKPLQAGLKAAGEGLSTLTKGAREASPLLDAALTKIGSSTPVAYLDKALNAITPGRDIRHASQLSGGVYGTNASLREMELAAARGQASVDAEQRFLPALKELHASLKATTPDRRMLGQALDTELEKIGDAIEAGTTHTLSPQGQKIASLWQQFGQERLGKEVAEKVMRPSWGRENYLTHRYQKPDILKTAARRGILGDPAFARQRDYDTYVQAKLHGLIPDYNIMRLGADRQLEGDRAIIYKRFLDDLMRDAPDNPMKALYMKIGENGAWDDAAILDATKKGFIRVRLPWQEVPLGVVAKAGEDVPEASRVVDYAFHPEVAKDLERMFTIESDPGAVGKIVDYLHSFWKPMATVVRPAFIIRNTASNIYMSLAGGMKMSEVAPRYVEASKLLMPRAMADLGLPVDPAKIAAAAKDPYSILGKAMGITGVVFGAVGEIAQETGAMLKAVARTPRLQALNLVDKGRTISSFSEDVGRMALFQSQLAQRGLTKPTLAKIIEWSKPGVYQNLNPAQAEEYRQVMGQVREASQVVNKWMINYAIKTPFEKKYMQRWMPFYTWSRRIVPLLVETAATRPALLNFQGKLKSEIEQNLPPEERMAEARRPEWMQQGEMFQLPSGKPGVHQFGQTGLPGPDLNVLPFPGGSSLEDVAQELGGRITPLKAIVEAYLLNRNVNMGPNAAIWDNYPGELKPASGTLTWMANHSPDMAVAAGMAKQGEAWLAPARLNYLSAQLIPLIETVGKAGRVGQPGQMPDADAGARVAWNILVGVPNVQRDTAIQEANRLKGAKRLQGVQVRDLARQLATRMGFNRQQ